jgi:hypothetical protein
MLRLTNLNCQKVSLINKVYDLELALCIPLLFASHLLITGFAKLHVGLVVLVKRMSVLINFLLQNTKQFCWSCLTGPTHFANSVTIQSFHKLWIISHLQSYFPIREGVLQMSQWTKYENFAILHYLTRYLVLWKDWIDNIAKYHQNPSRHSKVIVGTQFLHKQTDRLHVYCLIATWFHNHTLR